MPRRSATGGVLSLIGVIVLGTALATIPTPLYPIYEREAGLDAVGITATFAAFAGGAVLGLLVALLASGRLSRRRAYVIAASVQAASALLLSLDLGVGGFAAGRVVTGIGSGLLAASGTAFVMELSLTLPSRTAAVVRTGAPALAFLGLGLGPTLSAVSAPHDSAAVRLLFLVVGAAVVTLLLVSLFLLPSTAGTAVVSTAALGRRAVPWQAGLGGFAAFMTTGLFGSVTTVLLARLDVRDTGAAGLFAAVVFFAGALGVVVLAPRLPLPVAALSLAVALPAVAAAVAAASLPLLGLAALAAGGASGALFARSLRAAVAAAPEAAFRQTAAVFLCAYVGLAVPVLGFGYLARAASVDAAVWVFASAGAAVCVIAAVAATRGRGQRAAAQAPVSAQEPSLT